MPNDTTRATTPEQFTNELIAAIDHELVTYGPASLAEVIGTLVDAHIADEDDTDASTVRRVAIRQAFNDLAMQLPGGVL